jgi:hypothetical protein
MCCEIGITNSSGLVNLPDSMGQTDFLAGTVALFSSHISPPNTAAAIGLG